MTERQAISASDPLSSELDEEEEIEDGGGGDRRSVQLPSNIDPILDARPRHTSTSIISQPFIPTQYQQAASRTAATLGMGELRCHHVASTGPLQTEGGETTYARNNPPSSTPVFYPQEGSGGQGGAIYGPLSTFDGQRPPILLHSNPPVPYTASASFATAFGGGREGGGGGGGARQSMLPIDSSSASTRPLSAIGKLVEPLCAQLSLLASQTALQ